MKKLFFIAGVCFVIASTHTNLFKDIAHSTAGVAALAYKKAKQGVQKAGAFGKELEYVLHLRRKAKPFCTNLPTTQESSLQTENQTPYTEAAIRYSPIAYLSKKEKAMPMSALKYLQHEETRVVQQKNHKKNNKEPKKILIDKGQVTPEAIAQLAETHKGESGIFVEITDCITAGENPATNTDAQGNLTTTAYVKIDPFETEGKVYITYIFFYGFNFPYQLHMPFSNIPLPPGEILNAHACDIEHVKMELVWDTNHENLILSRIFYAAHGSEEGLWMDVLHPENNPSNESVTFENGHPVVYIAQGGHGCYPSQGTYVRIFGFANDKTEKGIRWTPHWVLIHPPQDPLFNPQKDGWILLPGNMGPQGVGGVAKQKWFRDPLAELTAGNKKNRHFCPQPTSVLKKVEYEICLKAQALKAFIPK